MTRPERVSDPVDFSVMLLRVRMPTDVQSWEENAEFWVEIMQKGMDRFRTELTDLALLDAIGDLAGRTILDAGCGEGYLSRIMASHGATVVGVDASAKLIAAARDANRANGRARFECADLEQLEPLRLSVEFDTVTANHLLEDLPDPAPMFKQFAKLLRDRGTLVILMLHPWFYETQQDRNGPSADPPKEVARTYFSQRHVVDHFDVAGLRSPAPATRYLRPLGDYTEMLADSGFVITAVAEPRPTDEQWDDAWWKVNFQRPLFLLIRAQKRER